MDPSFIVEVSASVLELTDTALETVLVARVRSLLPAEDAKKILDLRRAAAWGPGEMDLVKKSVREIALKYDWAMRYGPEILLGLMLTQYGVRQARVFATLSRIERELKQARPAAPAATVPPAAPAAPVEKKDEPKPATPEDKKP